MKVQDLLWESTSDYIVYRAYGNNKHHVYYGYVKGDLPEARANFIAGYNRNDRNRAEKRLVDLSGVDIDDIRIDAVDIFSDEIEAWAARNDARASDPASITGVTYLPGGFLERIKKDDPGRVARWTIKDAFSRTTTAREAWRLGAWTKEQLYNLVLPKGRHSKKAVEYDLDRLTPSDFQMKYKHDMINAN